MATNFPSAHNIGDRIEIGPTSTDEGPPVAWLGTVRGVRFLGGKVRYDIEDKDAVLLIADGAAIAFAKPEKSIPEKADSKAPKETAARK